MLYIAIGFAVIGLLAFVGRARPQVAKGQWRVVAGVTAVAAFLAAAYLGTRGGWLEAILLAALGVWTALAARRPVAKAVPGRSSAARRPGGGMSLAEARSTLGVGPEAGETEIRAAYDRLIRRVHPDAGGAPGLAAQLNAARDRLLEG
ncbi:molecular chaperone DnaJ [Caulobacter sp. CCUG 60055]|uniref:J domain-containing protein n=1 Tax=Caulobacter sp. CCUG 60055 TaxID=2100090 RepID=UPI001FA78238|nr:molecular chaperone DnaJ [Caulobacter sp. CCUG 60055]MCI3179126.1 molecular chaperone DnaJ [Caulobacter sp. CCUG 60055]